MEYYIVFNEWHYPTNDGRVFIGDFDSCMDAETATRIECMKELRNFQNNCGGYYKEGSGRTVDEYLDCLGYQLNSSADETKNFFFRSVIIKREIS